MPTPKNSEPNSKPPTGCSRSQVENHTGSDLLYQSLTEDFVGNDEERLKWHAYCQAALDSADEEAIQEAAAQITQTQGKGFFAAGTLSNRSLLLIPLAIIFLALVNKLHLQTYQLGHEPLKGEHGLTHEIYNGEVPSKKAQKRLTEEELLLVFGNSGSNRENLASLPLHERYPSDLNYLSDFLANSREATEKDFERAMVLDPDNGYFPLFYAGRLAEQSIKHNPQYSSRKPQQPRRIVTDPVKLERALLLANLAAEKARFVRPSNELQRKRMSLLPTPKTIAEEADYVAALPSDPTKDLFSLFELGNGIVTQAHLLALQKDSNSLEELTYTALKFVPQSLAATPGSIGPTAHHIYLKQVAKPLAARARENNLHPLATELDALDAELEQLQVWRKLKPNLGATSAKNGWPLLDYISSGYEGVADVTQATIADYEPGRMKWFLNLERSILFILAGFFLCFAALLFLLSFLRRKHTRNIIPRFLGLLSTRQWLLILTSSFLFPLICYLTVTRLTPLGCLDWSLNYGEGQPHAYNILSAATLFVVVSIALTTTLVRRQLSRLGLAHPAGWLIWVPTVLVLLSLLTAGLVRYLSPSSIQISAALGALGLLFLIAHSFMRLSDSLGSPLVRFLSARTLSVNFAGFRFS